MRHGPRQIIRQRRGRVRARVATPFVAPTTTVLDLSQEPTIVLLDSCCPTLKVVQEFVVPGTHVVRAVLSARTVERLRDHRCCTARGSICVVLDHFRGGSPLLYATRRHRGVNDPVPKFQSPPEPRGE